MKNDIDWDNIPKRWVDKLPKPLKTVYYKHIMWRWFRFCSKLNDISKKFWLMWDTGIYRYFTYYLDFLSLYLNLKNEFKSGVVRGHLEAFAETGTEGFIWIVYQSGKSGYEGMVNLDKGDRLIIFFHNGIIAFDGIIDPDYESGYESYPMNPEHGQPSAFGCWIHWTQTGWSTEDWASLFFHGVISSDEHPRLYKDIDKVPYRAIVVKKNKNLE